MKKIATLLIPATAVFLVCLMLQGGAEAAVSTETGVLNPDWTPWPSVGGGVVEFETRIGNGGLSGDWELGHKFNGVTLDGSGQYAISNGLGFDFALDHNAETGEFTMSLAGGPSTTWDSGRPCEAVEEIWFLAKTSNGAYTSEVYNLDLDGQPLTDSLAAAGTKQYLKIYGEPFSNFSLQGTMNFSWTSGSPSGSHIETLASVVFGDNLPGCFLPPVEMGGLYYDFIQDAYDDIVIGGSETLKLQAMDLGEGLVLDQDVIVTLNGGYDESFNDPPTGWTTIASLYISNGTVKINNIILR